MPDRFGREQVSVKIGERYELVDQEDLHERVRGLVAQLGPSHPITRALIAGVTLPAERYDFTNLLEETDRAIKKREFRGREGGSISVALTKRLRNMLASVQRWDDF